MRKRREGGFTLVEMTIVTVVTGMIIGLLGTAIYQFFSVSQYGNDRLTSQHELQNAAAWFNLDGQQAAAATGGGTLTLTLPDSSTITYELSGTELRRTAGGSQMVLARNITEAGFSLTGRLLTMQLTSAPPGRDDVSETGTYQVYLRPAGS